MEMIDLILLGIDTSGKTASVEKKKKKSVLAQTSVLTRFIMAVITVHITPLKPLIL